MLSKKAIPEKVVKDTANKSAAERTLDAELKAVFPMRQWSWEQRRAYESRLDAVLQAHIFGKTPTE
ncbi:MAG: hypothetical protein WB676_14405 [Bryobacteraceae bacterium]